MNFVWDFGDGAPGFSDRGGFGILKRYRMDRLKPDATLALGNGAALQSSARERR